jgi:hypothetical protein
MKLTYNTKLIKKALKSAGLTKKKAKKRKKSNDRRKAKLVGKVHKH